VLTLVTGTTVAAKDTRSLLSSKGEKSVEKTGRMGVSIEYRTRSRYHSSWMERVLGGIDQTNPSLSYTPENHIVSTITRSFRYLIILLNRFILDDYTNIVASPEHTRTLGKSYWDE
jgi:hypothetical protein